MRVDPAGRAGGSLFLAGFTGDNGPEKYLPPRGGAFRMAVRKPIAGYFPGRLGGRILCADLLPLADGWAGRAADHGRLITSAVVAAGMLPWVAATVPLREFGNPSLLWYVGIGVFIPGFARTIHFAGLQRIGASPSALIRGLGPLFSSSLAVLVLGEVISVRVAAGTGFIVLGIAVLSVRKGGVRSWLSAGCFSAWG